MPNGSDSQQCPLPERIAAFAEHAQELRKAAERQILLAKELCASTILLRQANLDFREFLWENRLNSYILRGDREMLRLQRSQER